VTELSGVDSSRRRARALQVLDQRMQQMKQFGQADISNSKTNAEGIQEV